jgi:hypothetical protein
LLPLTAWLDEEPRTTQDIAAALFEKTPYAAENPAQLAPMMKLYYALKSLGYMASYHAIDDILWYRESPLHHKVNEQSIDQTTNSKTVQLLNTFQSGKPKSIRFVISMMLFFNARSLQRCNLNTSTIAKMLFPAASQAVMNKWLHKAVDRGMWDIGYSPSDDLSEPDPWWWVDGDTKDLTYPFMKVDFNNLT